MKSINMIYLEMKDLKGNILLLKKECKKVDEEWESILKEVRDTVFNAAQGAKLYKETQEFLQERRLLKSQIEELEVQFELLGGDNKLEELKTKQDFKNVSTKKKDKKYKRDIDYYNNFREDIKEEVSEMYHITK